ncbi:hypothetical protein GGX14DRAFT_543038 [Mycena pura]|uniref:Uncharacterized protein n=1 Tax=Mycena pura TaxID=153505 RepID=A0AAD6VE17_9AGAR|nr:hypothetical protein GGX14DRAFT_543038 [Mycena pura]
MFMNQAPVFHAISSFMKRLITSNDKGAIVKCGEGADANRTAAAGVGEFGYTANGGTEIDEGVFNAHSADEHPRESSSQEGGSHAGNMSARNELPMIRIDKRRWLPTEKHISMAQQLPPRLKGNHAAVRLARRSEGGTASGQKWENSAMVIRVRDLGGAPLTNSACGWRLKDFASLGLITSRRISALVYLITAAGWVRMEGMATGVERRCAYRLGRKSESAENYGTQSARDISGSERDAMHQSLQNEGEEQKGKMDSQPTCFGAEGRVMRPEGHASLHPKPAARKAVLNPISDLRVIPRFWQYLLVCVLCTQISPCLRGALFSGLDSTAASTALSIFLTPLSAATFSVDAPVTEQARCIWRASCSVWIPREGDCRGDWSIRALTSEEAGMPFVETFTVEMPGQFCAASYPTPYAPAPVVYDTVSSSIPFLS